MVIFMEFSNGRYMCVEFFFIIICLRDLIWENVGYLFADLHSPTARALEPHPLLFRYSFF